MRKLKLKELDRCSVEEFKQARKIPLVFVCDNIRSALNVGSIFRTADALGCEKVVLCGITARPDNNDVHKTAIGATESMDYQYFDETTAAIHELKQAGYLVYAIEQTDQSVMLDEVAVSGEERIAIVLGNEVYGVSDEVLPMCHGAIEIPQYGTKHSFNVAVCTGIVGYQLSLPLRSNF